jgi:hypothetical protein
VDNTASIATFACTLAGVVSHPRLNRPFAGWECPAGTSRCLSQEVNMSKRVQIPFIALVCFLVGLFLAPHLPFVRAADNKVKAPTWMHGFNLKSRKFSEYDFNKDTKKYGIEVYKDEENGNIIYVSETGSIAVLPGK